MMINDKSLEILFIRVIDEVVEMWRPVPVVWYKPYQYIVNNVDSADILECEDKEIVHAIRMVGDDGNIVNIAIKSYIGYSEKDLLKLKDNIRIFDSKRYIS
jgi:hypothetical protein